MDLLEFVEAYERGALPDLEEMASFFAQFPAELAKSHRLRVSTVRAVGGALIDLMDEVGQGVDPVADAWPLAGATGYSRPTVRRVLALLIHLEILEPANPAHVGYLPSKPIYWLRRAFIVDEFDGEHSEA